MPEENKEIKEKELNLINIQRPEENEKLNKGACAAFVCFIAVVTIIAAIFVIKSPVRAEIKVGTDLNRTVNIGASFDGILKDLGKNYVEMDYTDFGINSSDGCITIEPLNSELKDVIIYLQPHGDLYWIEGINPFMSIQEAKDILISEGYDLLETNGVENYKKFRNDRYQFLIYKDGDNIDITFYNFISDEW